LGRPRDSIQTKVTTPTAADLESAQARLEGRSPGYLERVRRSTSRLAARDGVLGDPRIALESLRDVAVIDTEVPTVSSRREVHLLKVVIRRLIGWYLRFVGAQVSVLGQATVRLGTSLVERTEQLGDETATLQRDVAALRARLDALERGGR
jgi:hypothetical protein